MSLDIFSGFLFLYFFLNWLCSLLIFVLGHTSLTHYIYYVYRYLDTFYIKNINPASMMICLCHFGIYLEFYLWWFWCTAIQNVCVVKHINDVIWNAFHWVGSVKYLCVISSSLITLGFIFRGFFFSFCLLRAAPAAHGCSQARGPVGPQSHSNAWATAMPDPSLICNLHHSSRQCRILTERGPGANLQPYGS